MTLSRLGACTCLSASCGLVLPRTGSNYANRVVSMFVCGDNPRGATSSADPEGGQGARTPPPGKSQVIWVSIGNKQLDLPPPPWKKLDPPPGKCWTLPGTLKNDRIL